jgi:hypothetical protein
MMPATPAVESRIAAKRFGLPRNEAGLAFIASAILVFFAVLWTANGPRLEKIDFSVTYLGARMVQDGHGAKLYDLSEQANLRSVLFRHPNPLIYEHPPFEALLLAPLGALPYRTAYLIWGSINALIWLLLPYLLRPYAPVPKDLLAYLALWFIFAPLGVALFQGQSSLALLLIYALTFIALKSDCHLSAGVCLGLGLFKFQFVIPFALIFLVRKSWRFLAGFSASAAAMGLLSLAAVGWRGIMSYVHLLLNIGSNPENISYGSAVDMPTLHGFVYAILEHAVSVRTVSMIVATLSVVLIVFTAMRWKREERTASAGSFELMFAAALTVSLMTGLHMFTHDFSPLMLPLLLAAAHFPGRAHPGLRFALGGAMALFWFPPLYFVLVACHRLYLMFALLAVFWWAALTNSPVGETELM